MSLKCGYFYFKFVLFVLNVFCKNVYNVAAVSPEQVNSYHIFSCENIISELATQKSNGVDCVQSLRFLHSIKKKKNVGPNIKKRDVKLQNYLVKKAFALVPSIEFYNERQ